MLALLVSDATDCAQINTAVPGRRGRGAASEDDFFLFRMSIHVVVLSRDAARSTFHSLARPWVVGLDVADRGDSGVHDSSSFMRTEKYYA